MKGLLVLLVLCVCGFAVGQVVPDTAGWQVADATYDLMKTSGESAVYQMIVKNKLENGTEVDAYDTPPYLVRLKGSRHDMGADFATLVGDEVVDCYDFVLKKAGVSFAQKQALQLFLDTQWSQYLSKQVPQDFMDELAGMKKVSRNVHSVITRIIVVANLPSDLPEDMGPILADERASDETKEVREERERQWEMVREGWKGFKAAQCSMMAVWGERTEGSQLFSGRNLDYVANMGINPWKSVTIWIPSSSSSSSSAPIPHAFFGYLALYGALSGMNKAGLTVHEANLEEKNETFSGFPWVLRLRYIMEGASDLNEGVNLWKSTNNTVGYNHMMAHNSPSPSPAAVAMETAAHYTAFFQDMDPREQNCLVNGQSVGAPLPDALWRTNHPYDPALMNDYLWWGTGAYTSSQNRYMIAHDTIQSYEDNKIIMDYIQAINLTSNVADKGHQSPYLCEFPYASYHATNILSVTHQPDFDISYVAWDNGADDTWSPACCNTYVKVDFNQWW